MIGHRDGEPFISGVERRALRHRPRFEHPAHFQPQIEMQPGSVVLVNDKAKQHGYFLAVERDDLPEEELPPDEPLPDEELLAELPPLFFAAPPEDDFDAPPLLAPPERPADFAAVDDADRLEEPEPDLAELLEEPLPDDEDFDAPPDAFLPVVLVDLELPPDFEPPADFAAPVDLELLPPDFEALLADLPPLFAAVPEDFDVEPPELLEVDPPDLFAVEPDERPDDPDALFDVDPDDFLDEDPPEADFVRDPDVLPDPPPELVPPLAPPIPAASPLAMSAAVAAAPITAPRAAPVASSVTISTAPSITLSSVPLPPPDLFFVEPDCFLVAAIFFCLLVKFVRLFCRREYTYASA